MLVIPAIDIRDGKCVRLYQGDYHRMTVYSDHPAEMAVRWQAQGARYLHLVDLDGAARGRPANLDVVREVAKEVTIPIELGGGIRTLQAVEDALALGVRRVIVGTAAVEDRDFVARAAYRWHERMAVGIDARDGLVATHGWQRTSAVRALDLAREMVELGVRRFVYTDIHQDGTLTEPGYDSTLELVVGVPVPVIASGGVSRIEHLTKLRTIGVEGVIVGKALYAGVLDLREALAALAAEE
jgi:phosphoribosylformimino-5-aminoimidazole carboxamide ribotide isomerase